MQALTRNPLADPGLLGVNAGAAAAVVTAIGLLGITRPRATSGSLPRRRARVGARLRDRQRRPRRCDAGAARAGRARRSRYALIALVYGLAADRPALLQQYNQLVGRLARRPRPDGARRRSLPFVARRRSRSRLPGAAAQRARARRRRGAGARAPPAAPRIAGAVAVTLLCGAATAAAGPIAFVGLTVPHVARAIVGPDQRWVLRLLAPCSAPVLLLVADVARPGARAPGRGAGRHRHRVRRRARSSSALVRRRRIAAAVTAVRTGPGLSLRVRRRAIVAHARRPRARSPPRSRWSRSAPATSRSRPGASCARAGRRRHARRRVHRRRAAAAARRPRARWSAPRSASPGAVFQALTRNPLGSPDIVGFQAGCVTGALFVIMVLGGGAAAGSAGARWSAALATARAGLRARVQGRRACRATGSSWSASRSAALMLALDDYLLSRARDRGGPGGDAAGCPARLNGRSWDEVWPLAVALRRAAAAVLAPAGRRCGCSSWATTRPTALGVPRGARPRSCWSLLAVGLLAATTAASARSPFVALAAPQLARRLTGTAGPRAAARRWSGRLLVLASRHRRAAHRARHALPVGVVTGAVGGLYLLWLLRGRSGRGTA